MLKAWMEYLLTKESFKNGVLAIVKNHPGPGNKKSKWNFALWNKRAGGGGSENNVKKGEEIAPSVSVSSDELQASKTAWETPLKNEKLLQKQAWYFLAKKLKESQ